MTKDTLEAVRSAAWKRAQAVRAQMEALKDLSERCIEARDAGVDPEEIAKEAGLSPNRLNEILRPRRKGGHQPTPLLSEEDRDFMVFESALGRILQAPPKPSTKKKKVGF